MPSSRQRRSPWDVELSSDKREAFASWLARELDNALAVRTASDAEVAYWHTLYEQGRTRSAQNAPWPDAADLTSAIGTEKVDALRARIVKTIFVEPVFTVEGWGDSGPKAPFVEEFHQWQLEASRFQSVFARVVHLSLIEPRGVMEVYEEAGWRPIRRTVKAALQLASDGSAMVGDDLKPVLQRQPDGAYVEVAEIPDQPDAMPPFAEVVIDDYERIALGPRERSIPYRDYLCLPGHARETNEIWGHAKRFWRRVGDLKQRAKAGIYDAEAVTSLGSADERQSSGYTNAGATTLAGDALEIPNQEDDLAEKELWEVTLLHELDTTGSRWYVATIHQPTATLLRLQYDDIGQPRYFSIIPFPKPNSTEGYSFIGHKLITTIEENTAWRNMLTDRASIQVNVPIKRLQNAMWDPDDEPIGPKAVITVRDMNEVQAFQLPDYTAPARERIIDTERQAEKLGGMTDIASGSQPQENRTLGETRLVTAYSEVRIEEVVRNIQETLEDVAQVRHLMWKRALAEQPQGLQAPTRVLQGLETRGMDVSTFLPNRRFAASLLEGAFRFKPRGSVEATDKQQQRSAFAESVKALVAISQVNPMVAALLQQPLAAKALIERWVYLYNVTDKQAFLGPETLGRAMQQAMMLQQMQALPGGMAGQADQPGRPRPSSENPPSGPVNPSMHLPQERVGVM